MTQNIQPKWWQLYLTLPLLIALFVLEHRLDISEHGHQAVQIGILLLIYGLVHVWIKANSRALTGVDRSRYYNAVTVTRIYPYSLTESRQRPVLQLPASELTGILGDTFEMDYIDADCTSVDETAQAHQKE